MISPACQQRKRRMLVVLLVAASSSLLSSSAAGREALGRSGDTNCDGALSYADIDPFVLALSGPSGYAAAFPECPWLNADCNGDGCVDYADIDAFVALLSGPIGACCVETGSDDRCVAYECLGDMAASTCEAIGAAASWHAGESCDDPLFLCTGTPNYCESSGGCEEYISRVVCETIDNVTGCTQYGDYTDQTATAVRGVPLELHVWNGNLFDGDETLAWIDWNQDLDWDDEGEFVGTVVDEAVSGFVIQVPPAATPGYTRMRVRIDYCPPTPYDACSAADYGEVEDYTIIVSEEMLSGACCDPYTGLCADNIEAVDCPPPHQFTGETLCTEMVPTCGNPGACCNVNDATCVRVLELTCPPDFRFEAGVDCGALDPPCGTPGACCDDGSGTCTAEYEVNCVGRFVASVPCEPEPFDPPCGEWRPTGLLYCPTNPDNAEFRAAVSALLHAPVDYFDAGIDTPTLEELRRYTCVLTWVNYPYADMVAMGDVLAEYVDHGGRVLLGQWTQPTATCFLGGAIMEVGGAYLPATATDQDGSNYSGDGYGCPFEGVNELVANYRDVCTVTSIGFAMGTFADGAPCVAARADNQVWVSPGNTGTDYGSGEWARLTTNLCTCQPAAYYGACCDLTTGLCESNVNAQECTDFPLQWTYEVLCDDLAVPCGNAGACCNVFEGTCTTELEANCPPGARFEGGVECDALDPPCGTPGACCDDGAAACTEMLAANCGYRFVAGAACEPDPFEPACGAWRPAGLLYCPSHADNEAFREAVAELLGGAPVDYFDTRFGTPTLEELRPYAAVLTWVNYAYADSEALGNMLAQYVDHGGRVLLGQWTQPTAGNYLGGAIMEIDGPYLPALATARASGTYAGDGYGCAFVGVETLVANYRDNCTVTPIGMARGTWTDGWPCVAHRVDKQVWVTPGNTGMEYGSGDWAALTAGMCYCPVGNSYGACCDVETGLCADNVEVDDCAGYPLEWRYAVACADLEPACGNPGACCDDDADDCTQTVEIRCAGRFMSGVACEPDPFVPACGEAWPSDIHIVMWDDYGDGWTGGYLDVYLDGRLIAGGLTLESGFGPETVTLEAYAWGKVKTVWTAGEWPHEASYCIHDYAGSEMVCDGADGQEPTGVTVMVPFHDAYCGDGLCEFPIEDCELCPEDCGECGCLRQQPNGTNALFSDIDCDFCGSGPIQVLAENFKMTLNAQVTSLRIWGGYYPSDSPLVSDLFTVVFREDAGGRPGTVFSTYGLIGGTRARTGGVVFGVHEYVYELPVNEYLLTNETYWVEIHNDTSASEDSWFWEVGDLDQSAGIMGQAFTLTMPEEPWGYDGAADMALELVCMENRESESQ